MIQPIITAVHDGITSLPLLTLGMLRLGHDEIFIPVGTHDQEARHFVLSTILC
jgi:hypothetical protein